MRGQTGKTAVGKMYHGAKKRLALSMDRRARKKKEGGNMRGRILILYGDDDLEGTHEDCIAGPRDFTGEDSVVGPLDLRVEAPGFKPTFTGLSNMCSPALC
jgi:hypothetical protein